MNSHRFRNAALVLAACVCVAASASSTSHAQTKPSAADVKITYGEKGLASIRVGDEDIFAGGDVGVVRAKAGATVLPNKALSSNFDSAAKKLVVTYSWGTLTCEYTPNAQGLKVRTTLQNTSAEPITEVAINLFQLTSLGEKQWLSRPYSGVEGPLVSFGTGSKFNVALSAERTDKPATIAFLPLSKNAKNLQGAIANLTLGGERILVDNITSERPIAPNASDSVQLTAYFASHDVPVTTLLKEPLAAYAKENPPLVKWTDRRPIIRLFTGGGLPMDQAIANLKDPENIKPVEPDAKFQKMFLDRMKSTAQAAKLGDAQAVIFWDLEGDTFPHATTYIGDPRHIRVLNPQMDLVIDEGMKILKDAGLHVGLTIRPSRVVYSPSKNTATHSHTDAKDPFLELDGKVEYARKRWGCTVFYIDTNFFWRPYGPDKKWQAAQIPADVWKRLQTKYPDTLFVPEFGHPADYQATAPYGEADMGDYGTSPLVRAIWPDAFRVIVIEDADPYENFDRFVQTVRTRNVLMTFAFSPESPNLTAMRRIYQEARLLDTPEPPAVRDTQPDKLTDLLTAPDLATRFYAIARLSQKPTAGAEAALLARLSDQKEEWVIRRRAAEAFANLPYADAVPVLLDLVLETKPMLYTSAQIGLTSQGAKAAQQLTGLIEKESLLDKPALANTKTIERLADALYRMRAKEQAARLETIFGLVPDSKFAYAVRDGLLLAIGSTGNPDAENFLLEALKVDATKVGAARGLVRLGTDRALAQVNALQLEAKVKNDRILVDALTKALKDK